MGALMDEYEHLDDIDCLTRICPECGIVFEAPDCSCGYIVVSKNNQIEINSIPKSYNSKSLIAQWSYQDLTSSVIGIVGRYENGFDKKDIVPFFRFNGSDFSAGINLNPRPLFGLERLAEHPCNKAIFIVEGEKCAAAMQSLGCTAITSLGGCKAANKADWTALNGYEFVCLIPDNDEPGEDYAKTVYHALQSLKQPPTIKILRLPDLPAGGDCVDWLQRLVHDWNGYDPISSSLVDEVRAEFGDLLKTAEAVPDNWSLAGLDDTTSPCFAEIEPTEIISNTPPVEVLSVNLIPEPYREWIADVSHRLQTPADFVGVSAIVVTSSLIGAGCSVKPKRLDAWEVIPNLWGAVIARPSILLKSPCMSEVMRLLNRLQAEYNEQYEQAKAESEFDNLANDAMLSDVKKRLAVVAKGSGKDGTVKADDLQKLKGDYLELSQQSDNEPARRLFKTNETSVQAMTELQNENPRGLLVFRDELTGLLNRWEKDEHQDERAYYLEGFNGDGSYTDSKIGRGVTHAKNICISVLGGLQPDKLNRYLAQTLDGNNDGMMQRLQLAVYPDEPNPNDWQNVDDYPNTEAKNKVYQIMQTLAAMDFTQYGAAFDAEHDDRPYFRFNPGGQRVFNAWLENLQKVKICQEENPLMLEHLGKYRSLMPSLALIFHLINLVGGEPNQGGISEQSAKLAVGWCDYIETHARRVYALADSPEHQAAVLLCQKIKTGKVSSPFTPKDIYNNGWYGLKDKPTLQLALDILIESGWLVMTRKPPTGNRGRPPAPEYHLNPKIYENA